MIHGFHQGNIWNRGDMQMMLYLLLCCKVNPAAHMPEIMDAEWT